MSDGSGYNAQLVFGHVNVEAGSHGVRLTGPSLSVRQDGGIVPFETALDKMTDGGVVDRTLRRIQVVAKIERERLVLSKGHLRDGRR